MLTSRGDTIIEVILAVVVFSLIAVSSLSLMNRGTSAAQRSLELTLVRQQVDGQVDALRFLHDSYVEEYYSGIIFDTSDTVNSPAEEYYKIITEISGTAAASEFGTVACDSPPANSFVLNTRTAAIVTPNTLPDLFKTPEVYAKINYDDSTDSVSSSEGIWIEGVRTFAAGNVSGSIDFHVRGCWSAPGMNVPMNIGTIVRLYEPRG